MRYKSKIIPKLRKSSNLVFVNTSYLHATLAFVKTLLWLVGEGNEISRTDHKHLFDVTNDVSRGLPCVIVLIGYKCMSV